MSNIHLFVSQDIDDAEERAFLNSLSKNLRFGIYLFESIFKQNKKFELFDLVIFSLYRKLLELTDGIFILIDHNSLGAAQITARSVLEVYLSLSYIVEDKNNMEKRALSYFLFHKEEELKILSKQHSFDLLKTKYSEAKLQEMNQTIRKMKKEHPLKQIEFDKRQLISKIKSEIPRKYVKWYSIYNKTEDEIYSVNDLLKYVSKNNESIIELYGLLSLEVHGVNSIKDVTYKQENYHLMK
ncbi:DUF5677 domain-containing protein [Paenibacillus sp. sgz500958]|uniref:DUF5677 domain-containing protein n=1 Tax=Paenibacillus sp. sgz500958 TaxID=3242475 RepID=UPI0036D36576